MQPGVVLQGASVAAVLFRDVELGADETHQTLPPEMAGAAPRVLVQAVGQLESAEAPAALAVQWVDPVEVKNVIEERSLVACPWADGRESFPPVAVEDEAPSQQAVPLARPP
jgi:hypothetical protein